MLRESVSVLIIGRVPLLKHSTPFFDNLILLSGAIPSCCVNGIVYARGNLVFAPLGLHPG